VHWFRERLSDPLSIPPGAPAASPEGDDTARIPPLYFPGSLTGPGMGALLGLEAGHGASDLLSSVFIGLTYLTAEAFRRQAELAAEVGSVCAVGGMTANGAWMQMKSGSALLAGVGAGAFAGYEEASAALGAAPTLLYEPDARRHQRFAELYETTYRPAELALAALRPPGA
jgi:sugar (pentulose or hexulose) kinase